MAELNFSGLTCVIPTHNRTPFLRRQLDYIRSVESFPQLMIVDSSAPDYARSNRHLISQVEREITVDYQHDPSPFFEKLTGSLERTTTPFVVICADDDTCAPRGLATCLEAIRNDDKCAAAMGRCYILNTSTQKLCIARGYSLEHGDPLKRLQFYLNNWFSNYYAIHRRDRLIEQLRLGQMVVDLKRSRLLNEVLDSLLVACAGPLKFLDVDYLMYQIHGENLSKNSVAISDPSECDHLVQSVSNTLASYLTRRANLKPGDDLSDPYPVNMKATDAQIHSMLVDDLEKCPRGDKLVLDRMLNTYMSAQKIPGRGRSLLRRIWRKSQKLNRRIFGMGYGVGTLEKQDVSCEESSIRDNDMCYGFRLSLAHPSGIQPAASTALLGKTA